MQDELQFLQVPKVLSRIILDEGESQVLLSPGIFFESEDERRMDLSNERSILNLEE